MAPRARNLLPVLPGAVTLEGQPGLIPLPDPVLPDAVTLEGQPGLIPLPDPDHLMERIEDFLHAIEMVIHNITIESQDLGNSHTVELLRKN